MPQVNVNDEEVTLLNWHVPDGGKVRIDQPLCEVETSKSVGDVPSTAPGVVRHIARPADVVPVGQVIAYIGPSMEAIEASIEESSAGGQVPHHASAAVEQANIDATAGAIQLARQHGVDLGRLRVDGRIRRADVEAYLDEQPDTRPMTGHHADGHIESPPAMPADRVEAAEPLSDHQWAVAQHLARTQATLVTAHVVMDVQANRLMSWMDSKHESGRITGPLPVLLHAAAMAIQSEPRLASFRSGRSVHRYRSMDIAYTARSGDGRLFTPVVRAVDRKSLDELTEDCGRLNMAVFRGRLSSSDQGGGCLTVSVLSDQPVRFHLGLQNAFQSCLLTAGAIREELRFVDGEPRAVPVLTLTLSYDHGLMDGWDASTALGVARAAIEGLQC